jgi:hypothetical protein
MRTVVVVLLLALASVGQSSSPASSATRKGTVCWPLNFAGITIGVNTDAQVQRLLGKGVLRHGEGHTGGRYFIDVNNTATLHIVEGVDQVVEELTVVEGVSPEITASERAIATSEWFVPREHFGNWHALHLGSTEHEVLANLGEPQKKISANEWQYESTCACELPDYLSVSFKGGRLVQLALSQEE